MAATSKSRPNSWNKGVTQLMDGARHNLTAANLATAGAVALGAAAVAYFWDAGRRNAFLDSARRLTRNGRSFWNGLASPSINQ
ncbi:MAG: hypothetical protein ACM3YM_04880 [Sphingomonadales bacterium]